MLILPAVVAAIVTAALVPPLDRWARGSGRLLDRPNPRSSHHAPIPRVGGVALVIAVATSLAVAAMTGTPPIARAGVLAAGALALVAMSFLDDLRALSPLPRLAAHIVIAAVIVIHVGPWPLHPLLDRVPAVSMTLAGLWIVGLVNAYNFMDGIDGLASGQAVVAAAGWAIVGSVTGAWELTALALAVAAASAAFLGYNWHPARVFMGDTGSAFLGYTFAVLPLAVAPSPRVFAAAALFVWPFIFDAVFTFARRLVRGENVVKAHRSHLYQRLVSTGLSHRQVSMTYLALAMLGLPAGVCAAVGSPVVTAFLVAVVAGAAGILWRMVVRREADLSRRPAMNTRSRNARG